MVVGGRSSSSISSIQLHFDCFNITLLTNQSAGLATVISAFSQQYLSVALLYILLTAAQAFLEYFHAYNT